MDLLKPIEAFILVVREQGFSQAAHKLGVSTSTVSRLLKQLELDLGCCLLDRTTRHCCLTEAGRFFYEKAQKIVETYQDSKQSMGNLKEGISGTIKIGAPSSLSYLYLTYFLSEFLCLYPDVRIQLVNGDHVFDLLESGFDLVLYCRALPDSVLHYRVIGEWTRLLCATPRYLAEKGVPQSFEALKGHNCLVHYENHEAVWPQYIDNSVKNIPVFGNITTDSSLNLKNLVLQDLGIALLPSFLVARELQTGVMQTVLRNHALPEQPIFAVYSESRYHIRKIRVLLDFLFEKMQKFL